MAVGGDGTVNEVVNGIAGLDVELAVIPRGTGWDFVRTYRIPRKLEAAVEVALRGRTRVIDLGRAHYLGWDGAERERCSRTSSSAGMSGAIAKRANETSKALGGKVSYAWATFSVFSRWRNGEVTVRVDGEEHRGRMHDVIVANGGYLGGGMKMLPEAEPDDGRLRRPPDRRPDEARPAADAAEDLPRHAPAAPEGDVLRGAVVEVERPSPCPSSWTASSRARRRCASSSCRRRCACGCPA